ncbi:MAG: hypothetical protein KFH87_07680 [Bacteroidetes bacterium]|nr:hypothetical protein [Bacteroidota bacterium]
MNLKNNYGGCAPDHIESWYDIARLCPEDPRELIGNAAINSEVGVFELSDDYLTESWHESPISIVSAPIINALETTNMQKVANAEQWNFSHETWVSDPSLAPPLRKIVFMRGGVDWNNSIVLNFGSIPIETVQLSFLNNAATRGDSHGSIPVIGWRGKSLTENIELDLVIKKYGQYTLGVWTSRDQEYALFELVIISIP